MGFLRGLLATERDAFFAISGLSAILLAIYALIWMPILQGCTFASCYTGGFADSILRGGEPLGHIWLSDEPIEREHLSIWFYAIAWLVDISGESTLSVLTLLPFFLIPLGVVSLFFWVRYLTQDRILAAITTPLAFLSLRPSWLVDAFSEQFLALFITTPWTLYFSLKALRKEDGFLASACWAGLGFCLTFLVHKGFAFWLLLWFAFYFLLKVTLIRGIPWREVKVFSAIGLLTALFSYRFILDGFNYSSNAVGKCLFYNDPEIWVVWPVSFWPMLKTMSFFSIPQLVGNFTAVGMALYVLPEWWRERKDPGFLLLISLVAFEVAIYFTPFGYFLGKFLTFGFPGQFFMPGNSPSLMIMVGWAIIKISGQLMGKFPFLARCRWCLHMGLMVFVSAFGLFFYWNVLVDDSWFPAQEFISEPVIQYFSEEAPDNSAILSDPYSSFYLPALTGKKVVYVRSAATHKNHETRTRDASTVLDERVDAKQTFNLIRKRKITHIHFNPQYWKTRPDPWVEKVKWGVRLPIDLNVAMQKFRSSSAFREVGFDDGSIVFEVLPSKGGKDARID